MCLTELFILYDAEHFDDSQSKFTTGRESWSRQDFVLVGIRPIVPLALASIKRGVCKLHKINYFSDPYRMPCNCTFHA